MNRKKKKKKKKKRFQYFNFKTNFMENENLFQKFGVPFFS